jgi:sugar O-acyltransferase (sialic acid O-acetyltransferase NeuD family)
MNKIMYGVYGASGFGSEVMPLARDYIEAQNTPNDCLVFIDDNPSIKILNNHDITSYSDFLAHKAGNHFVALAIADTKTRESLAKRCEMDGVIPWSIQAKNVVIMDDVCLGEGSILSPFVTLTSNVRIGRFFHANIYSYVAHNCMIGDFVTFAPGVKCNGNVVIEDYAYIGTGAIIKQGNEKEPLVIGRNAVVGMGAVVTKNVPSGVTVIGNPAKPFIKD